MPTALRIIVFALLLSAPLAVCRSDKSHFTLIGPIVVNVRRTQGQLEYKLNDQPYSKRDLNYELGEMKLDSPPDRRVLVMLDESTYLSDIKLIPQMATDAGFKEIQVFAVFQKNGNMAELFFGPVRTISRNPNAH
jgi:biopolymer transport protein ExbD